MNRNRIGQLSFIWVYVSSYLKASKARIEKPADPEALS